MLFQLKRYDEAAASYERALSLAPDLPYAAGYLAQSRLRCCDWSRIEEDRARIAAGLHAERPVIDPFGNLIVSESPADQLRCARIAAADSTPPGVPRLWQGERYTHDKIRIAYLSADFRPHPVAFLIAGVFEHHDKRRFQTVGLSFGPESDSDIRKRIVCRPSTSSSMSAANRLRYRHADAADGDRYRGRLDRVLRARPDRDPRLPACAGAGELSRIPGNERRRFRGLHHRRRTIIIPTGSGSVLQRAGGLSSRHLSSQRPEAPDRAREAHRGARRDCRRKAPSSAPSTTPTRSPAHLRPLDGAVARASREACCGSWATTRRAIRNLSREAEARGHRPRAG